MDRSFAAWSAINTSSNNSSAANWHNKATNATMRYPESRNTPYGDIRLKYDSARSFDVDEDIEFNPAMTPEELNAAYAESSLSSRSGRSETSSPPQAPSVPLQQNPYAQQQQQIQAHHGQNMHSANTGRYNGRKNARNSAIPIVHPNNYGSGQNAW